MQVRNRLSELNVQLRKYGKRRIHEIFERVAIVDLETDDGLVVQFIQKKPDYLAITKEILGR